MKPKTNWNGLTEEAKETFFNFFMTIEFGLNDYGNAYNVCGECPGHGVQYKDSFIKEVCPMLCYVMFPRCRKLTLCPCHVYGDDAFLALKQCLIKDGWI